MEQIMNFQVQPIQSQQRMMNTMWKFWNWIRWVLGGLMTAMFVPSEADKQIAEGRERVRQLMARSY